MPRRSWSTTAFGSTCRGCGGGRRGRQPVSTAAGVRARRRARTAGRLRRAAAAGGACARRPAAARRRRAASRAPPAPASAWASAPAKAWRRPPRPGRAAAGRRGGGRGRRAGTASAAAERCWSASTARARVRPSSVSPPARRWRGRERDGAAVARAGGRREGGAVRRRETRAPPARRARRGGAGRGGGGRTCFRRVGVRALSCDQSDRCAPCLRSSPSSPARRSAGSVGTRADALSAFVSRGGPVSGGRSAWVNAWVSCSAPPCGEMPSCAATEVASAPASCVMTSSSEMPRWSWSLTRRSSRRRRWPSPARGDARWQSWRAVRQRAAELGLEERTAVASSGGAPGRAAALVVRRSGVEDRDHIVQNVTSFRWGCGLYLALSAGGGRDLSDGPADPRGDGARQRVHDRGRRVGVHRAQDRGGLVVGQALDDAPPLCRGPSRPRSRRAAAARRSAGRSPPARDPAAGAAAAARSGTGRGSRAAGLRQRATCC